MKYARPRFVRKSSPLRFSLAIAALTLAAPWAQGEEPITLAGHESTVHAVAFSPDGKTLASAGGASIPGAKEYDDHVIGEVKLWDIATRAQRAALRGHRREVVAVAFSPDGQQLASGSYDGSIKLWNLATGKEGPGVKGHEYPVTSLAFSPDGKTLASASYDPTIKLWDAATGAEKATLKGHQHQVLAVAFSPDGKTLASGSWSAGDAGELKLWDVAAGTARTTLSAHRREILAVAFSPDGKTLATASADKTVKLLDAATLTPRATLGGSKKEVRTVAFSPDGKTLATGGADGAIVLWDAASGKQVRALATQGKEVSGVAFSPDGKTLASAGYDRLVKLWPIAPASDLPAAAAVPSPYGVCAHLGGGEEHEKGPQELKLMREAGIEWARADFSWSGVERRRGSWSFDHLDATVRMAEEAGVTLLPILDYDTDFARPAYQHLDLWTEYVRQVVTRYKDRIRYWEVWNEPNLEQFWREKPNAANYTTLLKATCRTIRQIDPKLVVVMGGVSGIPWDYIEGIYAAGGKDSFDVMNVHPYRYPALPEVNDLVADLVRLRKLMTKYGDDAKPIWITEIGWPTHESPSGTPPRQRRGVTPDEQARILARTYLLSLVAGVDKIFWYEFQAMEAQPFYNEDHFGIVHRDLSPKPAYVALKTLTRLRPAGSTTVDGAWRVGDLYCPHWKRPDGAVVWALWQVGDPQPRVLSVEGTLREALDHLGQPVAATVEAGKLRIPIGNGPVYLVGPTNVKLETQP
ncbi:MAG: WD40 domain-containing protein [Pirellulales bacterium]